MGILDGLFYVAVCLIWLGLRIVIFFLAWQIIQTWKHVPWLQRLWARGLKVADGVASTSGLWWQRLGGRRLSLKGELAVSLATLLVLEAVLSRLVRLL